MVLPLCLFESPQVDEVMWSIVMREKNGTQASQSRLFFSGVRQYFFLCSVSLILRDELKTSVVAADPVLVTGYALLHETAEDVCSLCTSFEPVVRSQSTSGQNFQDFQGALKAAWKLS